MNRDLAHSLAAVATRSGSQGTLRVSLFCPMTGVESSPNVGSARRRDSIITSSPGVRELDQVANRSAAPTRAMAGAEEMFMFKVAHVPMGMCGAQAEHESPWTRGE